MGSQFVDLNADGHTDILSATFDGSAHIAWGSKDGYQKPTHLLDKNDERIIVSYIWDFEQKTHRTDGRALGVKEGPRDRMISAQAFDWENDGDYDLLLGSYEEGRLYLMMNEGSAKEPKYTGTLTPVLADGEPFQIPGKMTSPKLIDWNGDGELDIIAGSFGDSYGKGGGGQLYLSLNLGRVGEPEFGPLKPLLDLGAKSEGYATRPDGGLYVDAADLDGDGDLDLVVGGFSMWTPPARELSEKESARVTEIQKELADVNAKRMVIYQKASAAMQAVEDKEKQREAYNAVIKEHQVELNELNKQSSALNVELRTMVPSNMREPYTWFYRNQKINQVEKKPAAAKAEGSTPDEARR